MLVRPRGGAGRLLEESPSQRSFLPPTISSSAVARLPTPTRLISSRSFSPFSPWQVGSAETLCRSPSSPLTATCGWSSAAAAAGWAKASRPLTKVKGRCQVFPSVLIEKASLLNLLLPLFLPLLNLLLLPAPPPHLPASLLLLFLQLSVAET